MAPHPFAIVFSELMKHINGAEAEKGRAKGGAVDGCKHPRCRPDGAPGDDDGVELEVDPLPGGEATFRGKHFFRPSDLPFQPEPGYQRKGRRKDGGRGRRISR